YPVPSAICTVDGLTLGQIIPQDSHVTFDLDVSRRDVHAYLADALDAGLLPLTVTSLHLVVQQGGEFPTIYTKENVLVEFELADAAMLSLDVLVYDEPFTNPPDFDGDGTVGPADLAVLLAAWGRCDGCPEDLDGDGAVGPADLAILLAKWG
ncbi:MAG: hypothetical protein KDA25_00555, partial [Phycisphaerales bacterium]|nr:hypothetical protein [Phycisphaerales bacterium]